MGNTVNLRAGHVRPLPRGSPLPCKRPRVLHKFPGGGGERCPRQARQTNRALGGGLQLPEYKNGGWSIPAEDDQVAVIHTLTIHPDRAGQGLARQMVAFAEDTARSQGKTVMRFDTGVSNAVSNHLYPAIGYRFAGTVDTFFMGYVHCPLNLYEKKL